MQGKRRTKKYEKELERRRFVTCQVKDNVPPFLEMPEEFENIRDRHLELTNVAKDCIDKINDDFRPSHSALHRAQSTARKSAAAKIGQMVPKREIEPATTDWATPTVSALEKDGPICFSVDCRKLSEVTIRDSYLFARMDDCIDRFGEVTVFSTQ